MREAELRKRANCSLCQCPIGHTGSPVFLTVRIEKHLVNLPAIQRQDGLADLLGSSRLAQVMGSDEELTQLMAEPVDLTVCLTCAARADFQLWRDD